MRRSLFAILLASLLLCWGCDPGDDDDSASPPGDDDTAAGDDDTTPTDDDDTTPTDDDDTSNPAQLDAEISWVDTGVPGDALPTLVLTDLGGGDLQVDLTAWHLNCCVDLIVGAAQPAAGICRINIDDIGKPCYCESGMEVQVMVHGLDSGATDVTVIYGVDTVAQGSIEMAP